MKRKMKCNWTVEQVGVLLDHYESKGMAFCLEALAAMGSPKSEANVRSMAKLAGLSYKGPRLGCFKKGSTPASKGKKMSAEQYEKCKSTMFKKGCRVGAANDNYAPIGHISLRTDGYYWQKVAEKTWKQVHRLRWETAHGPIPAGKIVVFKDGNPGHYDLENLELIDPKELLRRNRLQPPSEYTLASGRAATVWLNKRGFGDRVIKENPELLELAKARHLLTKEIRRTYGTATESKKQD